MPIYLVCDGGKNKELGCYGSFMVLDGDTFDTAQTLHHEDREQFPLLDTHNEAEYIALIRGLEWVSENVFVKPKHIQLVIIMDSSLVLNQVFGDWKVRAKNLRPYWVMATCASSKFGAVTVWDKPREDIEAILGH